MKSTKTNTLKPLKHVTQHRDNTSIIEMLLSGKELAHWLNYSLNSHFSKLPYLLQHSINNKTQLSPRRFANIAIENWDLLEAESQYHLATICDEGYEKLLSQECLIPTQWQGILNGNTTQQSLQNLLHYTKAQQFEAILDDCCAYFITLEHANEYSLCALKALQTKTTTQLSLFCISNENFYSLRQYIMQIAPQSEKYLQLFFLGYELFSNQGTINQDLCKKVCHYIQNRPQKEHITFLNLFYALSHTSFRIITRSPAFKPQRLKLWQSRNLNAALQLEDLDQLLHENISISDLNAVLSLHSHSVKEVLY